MYDELVALLRKKYDQAPMVMEAADAIEERDKYALTIQHEMMAEAESHIALVERLNKQIKYWEDVVKTALDFIPCWTPVTERLPELHKVEYVDDVTGEPDHFYISKPVLIWLVDDDVIGIGNYEKDEDFGQFYYMGMPCTVTHWMPLPESPEEET